MNKIKEKVSFETDDGVVHDSLEQAEKYNVLLGQCDDILNGMISAPDDIDFINGTGWIQHPPFTKQKLSKNIIDCHNKYFDDDQTEITYAMGRMLDDGNIKCLYSLLNKYKCMTDDDKEFGQIFFANNPDKAKGGQIN